MRICLDLRRVAYILFVLTGCRELRENTNHQGPLPREPHSREAVSDRGQWTDNASLASFAKSPPTGGTGRSHSPAREPEEQPGQFHEKRGECDGNERNDEDRNEEPRFSQQGLIATCLQFYRDRDSEGY